jgi:hypothetical protein
VLWSHSAAVSTMLHLPLFLIVAVLRQQAGGEIPRSQGTFLEALADAALERGHRPTSQIKHALQTLARLTTGSGGTAPAAELTGDDAVMAVLETRLVVRAGRSLRFALPVVEQYFAAQSVLEDGLEDLDLDDLRLLDRWRDSLTLAVTVGSWQQVSNLLATLTPRHPGLASGLVASAVPGPTQESSSELPSHAECARRLRHALNAWIDALGAVGRGLGLTDSGGSLRTAGVFVDGNQLTVGLRAGDNAGVDVAQLPYGLDPFTGKAPDGSKWRPFRSGYVPADFVAWPWRWSLDWMSHGLESKLRKKLLPLPFTKPYNDERRWQLARAIMRHSSYPAHWSLDASDLRSSAEKVLSDATPASWWARI